MDANVSTRSRHAANLRAWVCVCAALMPVGLVSGMVGASNSLHQAVSIIQNANTHMVRALHFDTHARDGNTLAQQITSASPATFVPTGRDWEIYDFSRKAAACDMRTDPSKCSWASLGPMSMVRPADTNTGCLDPKAPYVFQVVKGSADHLLIYFQGGGACWSASMASPGVCYGDSILTTTAPFYAETGVFDAKNPDNPYRNYTVVGVSYCSGDMHSGNVVRTITGVDGKSKGVSVAQAGANNTMATLEWVYENFKHPKRLVISGCSAGSVAAQLWAGPILAHYNTSLADGSMRAAVVADSFAGVFPHHQTDLMTSYGVANTPIAAHIDQDMHTRLARGQLYFCEAAAYIQDHYPTVPFLHVQPATDNVQHAFYIALEASIVDQKNTSKSTSPSLPACAQASVPPSGTYPTGRQLYERTISLYEYYVGTGAYNFAPFIVQSSAHCFTPYASLYRINITTPTGTVRLVDWLSMAPLSTGSTISGECDTSGPNTCSESVLAVVDGSGQAPHAHSGTSETLPAETATQLQPPTGLAVGSRAVSVGPQSRWGVLALVVGWVSAAGLW